MGLDMYLNKKTYVWEEDREKLSISTPRANSEANSVDPKRVKYIVEEAGYWRKANAIHRWFVTNVQKGVDNCAEYYVSHDDLEELLHTVNKVLENPALADKLLPVQAGFFFGAVDYGDYYMQDLKLTKEIIEKALKDKNAEYTYRSSW